MHIQNSTLAGGVAVGTLANMVIHPFGAILIGFLAGIISSVGYTFVTVRTRGVVLHENCTLRMQPKLFGEIIPACFRQVCKHFVI